MIVSEIYHSRQGEGRLTGTPSVFVRTSGCNLRCGFCDTPFTSWQPDGEAMDTKTIVGRVSEVADGANHVVITGGEPMLPVGMPQLCQRLSDEGFHITIETAGTVFKKLACDLMSISPKMSNSVPNRVRAGQWAEKHAATRLRPNVVRQLMDRHDFQLKFVVDRTEDVQEILDYLPAVKPFRPDQVYLMPQGVDQDELTERENWLAPICDRHGFVLCRRMHIQWYGNRRGT